MSTDTVQDASFESRLTAFPIQHLEIGNAGGIVGYRAAAPQTQAAHQLPVILLHGIGSGSASWVQQFEALGEQRAVFAWDAPGYGESTPVDAASPAATDYAQALAGWLDALQLGRVVLVGHSLGAIMATAFAAAHPERVAGLLLISPAAGYGMASPELRVQKRDSRLAMLAELGPAGLAAQRSGNMLSAHAVQAARDWVRWNMARIVPQGYAQATHLLANADLISSVRHFKGPVGVAVGAEDSITPSTGCARIAQAAGVSLQLIPRAGHAGYIEAPQAYTALIGDFCRKIDILREAR